MISLNKYERIRQLAREGLGYEDISAQLNLPWREVRPFVIKGVKHGDVSEVPSKLGKV